MESSRVCLFNVDVAFVSLFILVSTFWDEVVNYAVKPGI